jgi:hypothetical protein
MPYLSECVMVLTIRWPLLQAVFNFQENNYAEHVRQYHHLSDSEARNDSHLMFWYIWYIQYENLCNVVHKYCG